MGHPRQADPVATTRTPATRRADFVACVEPCRDASEQHGQIAGTSTIVGLNLRRIVTASRALWPSASSVVAARWAERVSQQEMTAASAARYGRLLDAFSRYATAHGVLDCDAVTALICVDFVDAALAGRQAPSPSTRRLRLSVVRAAYRGLIGAGVTGVDPTIGLRVEGPTGSPVLCPLRPPEVERLRAAGRTRPGDTVRPAAVTIALMGGSHRDISAAIVSDVDFLGGRLRLGRATSADRWVALDSTGSRVLQERLAAQRRAWRRRGQPWNPHSVPLAMHQPLASYPPSSIAPSVSVSLSRALHRAGVNRAGVRPRSVREFAANRTYALTRRVEDVAEQLGLSSLDTAAHFVDHAWQDRWGDVIRGSAGSGG